MEIQDSDVYDVIIIGAGLSGLHAAYVLKKRCEKLRILIVEAKDRVGGRTLTIELNSSKGKSRWDIGGQWVTEAQKNISKLIKELNIETYNQYDDGRKILVINRKVSTYDSSIPHVSLFSWLDMQQYMKRANELVDKIDAENPFSDQELAARLDSSNLRNLLSSLSFTSTVGSIFNSNLRTVFGQELNQVNALYGLFFIKSGGGKLEAMTGSDQNCAQENKVKGGTQQISKKMLDFVLEKSITKESFSKILYNTALIEVIQNENDENELVQIVVRNNLTDEKMTYKAKRIISSIPINQYITVKFNPKLPIYKRNFFKFFQIGNYIKYIVTYKTQFWREKGFSGEGSSDGSYLWLNKERFEKAYSKDISKLSFNKKLPTVGAVSEAYDGTNDEGEPALVGFLAGESAVEWADQSDEVRKNEVIEGLVNLFGNEARNYIDYIEKNWNLEPYNGGCPTFSVSASGCMQDHARATREPFLNVYFCGTESATNWPGYMDGAIESGERAANEVLYSLFGSNENNQSIQIDYEKTYYFKKKKLRILNEKKTYSIKNNFIYYSIYSKNS